MANLQYRDGGRSKHLGGEGGQTSNFCTFDRLTLPIPVPLSILVAVKSSGILKAKQKLGVTFNSDKLGGIDFTKFSKLTMCSA